MILLLLFLAPLLVSKSAGSRRPPCDNLYDVFKNICDEEAEHVKIMIACQDYAKVRKLVVSPHLSTASSDAQEELDQKRQKWKDWAIGINEMNQYDSRFYPVDDEIH